MKLFLKVTLVGVLFYFLAHKGFISFRETRRALAHWELLVPAVGALGFATVLGVIRWQWLLRAQGIQLGWKRIFQIGLIGNFFNIALPGAVSGDFVKAFYIGREVEGKRARAFGSILFDRVAGLSALILVSAGALAFGFRSFWRSPLLEGIQVLLATGAIGVISFYAYLFLVTDHRDPLLRFLRSLEKRRPRLGSVTRIYEGLRHYHHHRETVLKALAISICIHLIVGWSCLQFAFALGQTQLELLPACVVVPLGLLVTAVPVLPAGVGTGHAAFLYFFKLIGSPRGADVFTFMALTNFLIGGVGGVVYLQFRGREPRPDLQPKRPKKA